MVFIGARWCLVLEGLEYNYDDWLLYRTCSCIVLVVGCRTIVPGVVFSTMPRHDRTNSVSQLVGYVNVCTKYLCFFKSFFSQQVEGRMEMNPKGGEINVNPGKNYPARTPKAKKGPN